MDGRHDDASSFHGDQGISDTQAPSSESAFDVIGESPASAEDTSILEPPVSAVDTTILEPPVSVIDTSILEPQPSAGVQPPSSAAHSAPFQQREGDQRESDVAGKSSISSDPFAPLETLEASSWASRVNAAFDTLDAYGVFTESPRNIAPDTQGASDIRYPTYPPLRQITDVASLDDTAAQLRTVPGSPPRRAAPPTKRLPHARKSGWRRRAFLLALILLCFLLGYGGVYGAFTISDALAAARDAKTQATAIQGILHGGHLTDAATLTLLKARLQLLDADFRRIRSDEPGQPVFTDVFGGTAPMHALNMAQDLTWAGLYAVDAGLVIAPHIKSIVSSVTGSATGTGSAKTSSGSSDPLTLSEINQASADVNSAGSLVTLALAERAQVRDSDLQALGFGSFVNTLHTLDAFAPKLPAYLDYGRKLLAALPDLLGVTKPVNYLLLNLDSDELRPSGGFQGVYGMLTFKGARLTSGVHLQNIYGLDCQGGFPPNCPYHPLPSSYNWFTYHDGLRNANLDPSYPATARLDERMLAADHGPAVAGVISLTPVIIQQALTLTGPLTVPGYPQKMTAKNFSELIHYYHSIVGSANITKSKAFDAAAGGALLHAFAKLSQADQSKFVQGLLSDLRTGDLQVYVNDQRVESVLTALGMDGALRSPAGDTYMVVNANHGANYVNADVTATESDHVVINAQGAATHTLTITYHFPVKQHMYTQAKLLSVYSDFIQVIAPSRARLQSIRGCAPLKVTEPGWADWACNMTLSRGGSATVVFQWVTPNATARAASGAAQYNLLVQRQVGTHNALVVTIAPPSGARLSKQLMTGLTVISGNQARYSAALTDDQALSLAWQGA